MPDLFVTCVMMLALFGRTPSLSYNCSSIYKIIVPAYLLDIFRGVTGFVGRNSHRLFSPRMWTTYKAYFMRGGKPGITLIRFYTYI